MRLKILCILGAFLVVTIPALAEEIDFDDAGGDLSGITNRYPGVTFNGIANAWPYMDGNPYPAPDTLPEILGGAAVWDPSGQTAPGESAPNFAVGLGYGQPGDGGILMTFDSIISSMSVTGLDFGDHGGDGEYMTLTAYNSAGNRIGQGFFTAQFVSGAIRGTIAFEGTRYVAFNYTNTLYGFYGIDDLEYTPVATQVPEPGILFMIGSGLLGLLGMRKRFAK